MAKDKNVLTKRTQAERIAIAESLLSGIWEEIEAGQVEPILQAAVNAQIDINRIVFKINYTYWMERRKNEHDRQRDLLDDDPSHPYADDVMMGD